MSCFGAPVGCCCSQEAANGPVEWASPWHQSPDTLNPEIEPRKRKQQAWLRFVRLLPLQMLDALSTFTDRCHVLPPTNFVEIEIALQILPTSRVQAGDVVSKEVSSFCFSAIQQSLLRVALHQIAYTMSFIESWQSDFRSIACKYMRNIGMQRVYMTAARWRSHMMAGVTDAQTATLQLSVTYFFMQKKRMSPRHSMIDELAFNLNAMREAFEVERGRVLRF